MAGGGAKATGFAGALLLVRPTATGMFDEVITSPCSFRSYPYCSRVFWTTVTASLLDSSGSDDTTPEIGPGPSWRLTLARVQRSTPRAPPLPVGNAFRMLMAPCERA